MLSDITCLRTNEKTVSQSAPRGVSASPVLVSTCPKAGCISQPRPYTCPVLVSTCPKECISLPRLCLDLPQGVYHPAPSLSVSTCPIVRFDDIFGQLLC